MASTASHREQRMGIQWRKLVFGFIPIRRLTKGLQPSHPRLPTVYSLPYIKTHQIPIPPHPAPRLSHSKKGTVPIGIALLFTPSLTLPPSSLKCLQKSNPNIHSKCIRCFKCFGCFRCFISLLDHKTAPFWSKSEQTRKIDTHPPPP